jgi:hypothetical protein
MQDSTRAIEAVERASIARLMEASRDAIRDPRLRLLDRLDLAQHLAGMCDQAALALRQGYRAHLLDRLTADLDQRLQQLADAAPAPERNPADPFTVETPHRPITNSGP